MGTLVDSVYQHVIAWHEALVHPAANAWDDRVLQNLWMAAERYTHLVFDPTRITDAERSRRYETHRVLRDAEAVWRDVQDGYVSLAAARERYGVVLDPVSLEIDQAATAALRRG